MFDFIKDYRLALCDSSRRARTILIHAGLPVAAGALSFAFSRSVAASRVIEVVAIVSGLLFSMLVLLIDLRGRVRRGEDKRVSHDSRDSCNLDYAYYSTHYAIVAGFTALALLLFPEGWWSVLPHWLQIAYNWAAIALVVSFATAVLHSLKRLRRSYQVFGRGEP